MAGTPHNSLDFLRLCAATFVLYSHQHALLGQAEPSFLGWTTWGGVGVSVFFFLSGYLVWSSWVRDAHLKRFFQRRALRIFPALVFLVLVTVLCIGPVLTTLSLGEYFASSQTWRYLSTAVLVVRQGLPGVFVDNPYPLAVNGSLWTLPVEFLCYGSVALVGSLRWLSWGGRLGVGMALALLGAALGVRFAGERFVAHFEMVAFFWWGAVYAWASGQTPQDQRAFAQRALYLLAGLLVFWATSPRGLERTGMLLCAAAAVVWARQCAWGARLTDRSGDLSYGMYIYAFPVQQLFVLMGNGREWPLAVHFLLSFLLTTTLAYASWHALEKPALRFKPKGPP